MKTSILKQVDQLIAEIEKYDAATLPTAKQVKSSELAGAARASLLALVLECGVVPSSAPSSKRLLGSGHQVTATSGTYTTQNDEAVLQLREAMVEREYDTLFSQLFTTKIRYDRVKEAANNLRNATLSKKWRDKLEGMLARTFTEKPRTAVLRIDPIK